MSDTLSQPFKNFYDLRLARLLADKISAVSPSFPAQAFVDEVAAEIEPLELKARVSLMARALRHHLPPAYPDALAILLNVLGPDLSDDGGMFDQGYWVMPIAQFVEEYGLDHFELSAQALHDITRRFTAEFAVRPYLIRYPDAMLSRLRQWAHDPNPHVRRWVSEGTRPRLPWAKRLDAFIADPTPTLELLELLKDDPSLYVRKSVANHLNDIAKDHPLWVIETAERWYADGSEERRWIVRHALRTLVKQGDARALAILGYDATQDIRAILSVQPATLVLGGTLMLTAEVSNVSSIPQKLVIDYCVYFVRANGSTGAKVFKWTSVVLDAGETINLSKKQPLRPVTTRSYYPGVHRVTLQVNGAAMAEAAFTLVIEKQGEA
jgi:3-methyladenine DNA glycosylase AlkC